MAAARALDDKTASSIASRYEKGETSAALAAEHGVSTSTILKYVSENGVQLRPRGGVPGRPRSPRV